MIISKIITSILCLVASLSTLLGWNRVPSKYGGTKLAAVLWPLTCLIWVWLP